MPKTTQTAIEAFKVLNGIFHVLEIEDSESSAGRKAAETCIGQSIMHVTKITGKPYEGKLHVRFDEGALKIE